MQSTLKNSLILSLTLTLMSQGAFAIENEDAHKKGCFAGVLKFFRKSSGATQLPLPTPNQKEDPLNSLETPTPCPLLKPPFAGDSNLNKTVLSFSEEVNQAWENINPNLTDNDTLKILDKILEDLIQQNNNRGLVNNPLLDFYQ